MFNKIFKESRLNLSVKQCFMAITIATTIPSLTYASTHGHSIDNIINKDYNFNSIEKYHHLKSNKNPDIYEEVYSYNPYEGGLTKYENVSFKTINMQLGDADLIANKIRMHDFNYLFQITGSLRAKSLDLRRTQGSGTFKPYGNGSPSCSPITFAGGGNTNVDEITIYNKTKWVQGIRDYDPSAYGLQIDNTHNFGNSSSDGNARINIIGVIADNAEANGVSYRFRGGDFYSNIDFDITNINGTSAEGLYFSGSSCLDAYMNGYINISNVNNFDQKKVDNSYLYGIHTNYSSCNIHFQKNVSIRNIINEHGKAYGIFNEDRSNLIFEGGLQISLSDQITPRNNNYSSKNDQLAIYNKYQITILGKEDILNIIEDDIVNERYLNATFGNRNSYFKGAIITPETPLQESKPYTELTFTNGSYWTVTNDSSIECLGLHNSGFADLTQVTAIDKHKRNVHLTTDKLIANNGLAKLHLDLKNQNLGSLITAEDATGTLNVNLSLDNVNDYFKKSDVPLIIISKKDPKSGSFKIGNLTYRPGAAHKFKLVFFKDNPSDQSGMTFSESNGGWYLVNPNPQLSPDSSVDQNLDNQSKPNQGGAIKPPVTDEVDQVLSLGTSLTQAVGMLSETEDLRMRMGDVRHGDTDGLWVRTYSRKDSAHGSFGNGFEQDVHGFHIGADHVIRSNDNASWLVGGAFHYGKSDIEGAAEAGGGDADIDQYTFKAYATYMKDNGAFADIVLHTGYYDTTLTGKDNTGLGSFKGDYSNWGYGVSAEVGHRFDLSNIANRWYIEPTAQLTWFHAEGKNFKTSTGLEINQGDADFITGRLGAAVGKVFALGAADDPMSSYFSVAMKGGMLYQFDGDQTITAHGTDGATVVCADAMDMKGARAYYGINADWKIDDTWRVYGQISREEGSGYTKDYDASIGVRYAF